VTNVNKIKLNPV